MTRDDLHAIARRMAELELRGKGLRGDSAVGLNVETLTLFYLPWAEAIAEMPETWRAAREAQRGHVAHLAEEHC